MYESFAILFAKRKSQKMSLRRKSENLKNALKDGFVNAGFESEKSDTVLSDDVDKGKSKVDVDFDDLIPHIGNFGKYQIILFLLLAPYTFFFVFVYFTQIFITLIPEQYWCNVPELQHLELEDRYKFVPIVYAV